MDDAGNDGARAGTPSGDDLARRSYHHGDLKNALLDAATRLIDTKGVAGLSLRGVAREAGVSQAAPYHHFKDKEALVAELCKQAFGELGTRMAAALEGCCGGAEPADQLEALDAVGRTYLAFSRERRAWFAIMWGGDIEDKEAYPELVATARCTFEMLVGVIVRGQEQGDIRPGNPVELAVSSWAAVHGAARLIVDKGIDNEGMRDKGIDAEMVERGTLDMVRRALTPA